MPDGSTTTYTYDPFGRRIRKQTTETTNYLYANEGLIGEYDTNGTTKKAYAWRPNSIWGTNPLLLKENGATYYYHNDHLGTPRKMTDVIGAVVWSASYSAFGEAEVDEASTLESNLRFPGQYYDEETNLHYNWNRYYDPEVGRYISKDPIGFGGGDVNLYRYVSNNPINLKDPTGLAFVVDDAYVAYAAMTAATAAYVAYRTNPNKKGSIPNYKKPQKSGQCSYKGPPPDGNDYLKMLAGTSAAQFVSDFIDGAVPGGPPPPTFGGLLGSIVGDVIESIGK